MHHYPPDVAHHCHSIHIPSTQLSTLTLHAVSFKSLCVHISANPPELPYMDTIH
ncbi:hypothetical protein Patl1_06803 [Pistacia atlantica]|uniref:Uncharacterized protein n=1 Tax=Pistacia atlantica TaxID=434234 RepID=A0ACC1BRP9_9ROSI|nr:hypothetical protein Patl1_06803 [Pistacia atlantica]